MSFKNHHLQKWWDQTWLWHQRFLKIYLCLREKILAALTHTRLNENDKHLISARNLISEKGKKDESQYFDSFKDKTSWKELYSNVVALAIASLAQANKNVYASWFFITFSVFPWFEICLFSSMCFLFFFEVFGY